MTGAERENYIWSRLTAAGLTPAGAAGLMGNLYAESGLNPANLQNTHEKKLGLTDAAYTAAVDAGTYTNFAGDGAGYGLAQWTYKTRKWTKWGKIPYINYEEEIENMSKEELKALIRETVREVLDEENPVYKDLKDVPEYWKPTAAALLEAGAVNGGTPAEVCATDLNSSSERGSNEKQNGMTRRRHPKGTDFKKVSRKKLRETTEWINNYPRKMFGFHTAAELFAAAFPGLPALC